MEEAGIFEKLHKKEAVKKRKEIEKLNKFLRGIKYMTKLPEAVFIVDIRKERIALAEANKLGIKVIAIVDTNCDPTGVDFPIPGNDDAIRSIRLFTQRISELCLEGQELAAKKDNTAGEKRESPAVETLPETTAVESAGVEEHAG